MSTKNTEVVDRFVNPLNLMRAKYGLPVFAIALISFTAMSFGSGVVQKIGSLLTGMYGGIFAFGYLLDPRYLTDEGLKKGLSVRDSEEDGPNEQGKQ